MKKDKHTRIRRPSNRRAFTLVELVVAGIAGLLVVGAVTSALFQSARARATTKSRLVAYARANSALDMVRSEIASTMRRSDLFETRVVLYDDVSTTRDGDLNRDELLLFTVSLRAVRPIDYEGEGQEYESQFRIGEDHTGTALWQRRDAVLDEWCDAGGIASPVANGIISLEIQAYDGESWFDEWDSDIDGLPWALRVSVTASGNELGVDPLEDGIPQVTLRTQIAIDRIIPPPPEEEDDEEDDSSESTDEDATEENQSIESSPSAGGRPSNGGRPGSSVNQPGRGDNSIGSGGSRGNSGSQGGIDRE